MINQLKIAVRLKVENAHIFQKIILELITVSIDILSYY